MSSSVGESSGERHLHPVGMLLAALGTIRRWIGAAALPGVASLVNGNFGMRVLMLVLLGVALVGILSAVWGILSWQATTYRVEGGALHFKRGVLQKSERSLPLERVQSVEIVQGIVQRVFDVVGVRIEAAGGRGEAEILLPALSKSAAEALREELTKSSTRRSYPEGPEEPAPAVIRRLPVRDLLLAGLTSGRIGVAASVVFGGFQFVDDLLPGELAERLSEVFLPRTISAAVLLVLAIALFSWVLAVLGTVLTHAGFTLSRSADGEYLHIKRGLLERRESTVPLARIQAIKVIEGILRQPFGFAALRVESAGFGAEKGVSTVLFPLLPRSEVENLLQAAVPEFVTPLDRLDPLPDRALRRYAIRPALPVLLLAAPCAVLFFPWGLAALLLAAPAALYGLLRYQAAGHALGGEQLILRFRRLARTIVVVPWGRLQSRGYSVSPLQRRKRLGTLKVEVASGFSGAAFRLTDVEVEVAEGLIRALPEKTDLTAAQECST
ncbi:MAG: PH domain-containing protein [Actinobacteria bacterium]|nr:PH domain-containing protein [Actinomycetota bacterium]